MKKQANASAVTVTIETPGGLNSQTGKSEEIEILAYLTDRVRGTQTYLEQLFTQNLFEWVTGKIRDDFSTDIFMEYQAEIETNRNLTAELNAAKIRIDGASSYLTRYEAQIKEDRANKDAMINKLSAEINQIRHVLNEERETFNAVEQERNWLKSQVKDLKVMLFDLQNKPA